MLPTKCRYFTYIFRREKLCEFKKILLLYLVEIVLLISRQFNILIGY